MMAGDMTAGPDGAQCSFSPSARLPPAIPTEVPMRRIGLVVVLAVSLFAAPLAIQAQQTKVARVGVLSQASPGFSGGDGVFAPALRDFGYIEGVLAALVRPRPLGAAHLARLLTRHRPCRSGHAPPGVRLADAAASRCN